MIVSVPYTCIGSESQTINIPAASGRDVIAVFVDGFGKQMVSITPESSDQVQIDTTRGDFTLAEQPFRGLNILVIHRMHSDDTGGLSGGTTNLNDFVTDDFSTTDFF